MRLAVILLLAAAALTGCSAASSPSASPAFTPQAECERTGGWWHPDPNYAFCEYQSPGLPLR
jgi:ABC-type glycerol-3-phosphate transport system substrate-binding protein